MKSSPLIVKSSPRTDLATSFAPSSSSGKETTTVKYKLYKLYNKTIMSSINANSSSGPYESAIVSESSNFVLQKYIRQKEIDSCTTTSTNSVPECACKLAGSTDLSTCTAGFNAYKSQGKQNQADIFEPLKWCLANQPSVNSDAWLIGCVNGIRK